MGAPLYDITIYHEGNIIKDAPCDWGFRRKANFIADFYHDRLNGYKPPKTGRICVNFVEDRTLSQSYYFGSICTCENTIKPDIYLNLPDDQKNRYILDLMHESVMNLCDRYGWEKSHFQSAYDYICQSNFKYEKIYPSKKSPDRKYSACAVIEKTEERASLRVIVQGKIVLNKVIVSKRNWWWYDTTYSIAKHCKWLNNYTFGANINDKNCYLCIPNGEVINDLVFEKDES